MQIRWLEEAILDLQKLHDYIKNDKPQAASRVASRIIAAVELLEKHPSIGKPGRVPYTRELIIKGYPYILPYRVKEETIEILRVFHTSLPWPESL